MGEGPVVAVVRGLKVHIRVLDEFLHNNGCNATHGYPPFYEKDPDEFTALLRSRLGEDGSRTRLFIPKRADHDNSKFGYIAWAYEMVYAQKELSLERDLPADPPEGWDSLKNDILSFSNSQDAVLEPSGHGKTGVFIIVCEERSYYPPSMDETVRAFLVYFTLISSALTKYRRSLLTVTNAKLYWTTLSSAKDIAYLSTDRRKACFRCRTNNYNSCVITLDTMYKRTYVYVLNEHSPLVGTDESGLLEASGVALAELPQ